MSEQLELLNGDEFHDPRAELRSLAAGIAEDSPTKPYPEPHSRKGGWSKNPVFSERARQYHGAAHLWKYGEAEETFLPTYELESPQSRVQKRSIAHMEENASGLDVPNVSAYQFGNLKMVADGNHRLNAALNRGQMLIPATLRKAYQ